MVELKEVCIMKKAFIILALLFGSLVLTTHHIQAQVVVVKPVPPKNVVKRIACGPNRVWIDGHWRWNNRTKRYVWVKGHCAKKKRGHAWVPGHWKKVPGGWRWVPGHWRRA